jgi:hypothetical protein
MDDDAFVLTFLKHREGRSFPVSRSLLEDTDGWAPGELWAHVEDMARRGLVVIEGDMVRLP